MESTKEADRDIKETFSRDYDGRTVTREELRELVEVMPDGILLCVAEGDGYD